MNVKNSIKQYGYFNSFKRFLKYILRKLGIHYESYWYMVNTIDINAIKQKMQKYSYDDVKELNFVNFKNGDPDIFNKKKLDLIKNRFESGKFWCYGIFHNSQLIYSTWISKNTVNFNATFKKSLPLHSHQAVLEDSYCHPKYRGQGLHSKMNLYRMKQIFELNNTEIIAIVLKENKPAIKVQLKSGFKKNKKITLITLFNKSYYIEKVC